MVKRKLILFLIIVLVNFFFTFSFAQEIDRLKACFLEGDYHCAIIEGEKALGNNIDKQHSDELYYFLGLSYLKEGNYLRASDIFAIVINEFKQSPFKDDSALGLGDTYFLQGDWDKAGNYYSDLLKNNPHIKLKAQLYFRLSKIAFKKGDTASGKAYADKLALEFPLSPEALVNNDIFLQAAKTTGVFYSVQVGSFSSSANAGNLSSILNKKGYSAFVEEGPSKGNDKIYRVKVGKFSKRQEAIIINDKLIQEGYPTRITP
ncbi:MAG: SPOR domain-containing protein [Candidatus Omnitrophota bacterium]|jgi:tetratricopeptide (TPR) repeat protein